MGRLRQPRLSCVRLGTIPMLSHAEVPVSLARLAMSRQHTNWPNNVLPRVSRRMRLYWQPAPAALTPDYWQVCVRRGRPGGLRALTAADQGRECRGEDIT